jgi:hypothetical protein
MPDAGMPVKKLVRHRHFYRQSNASVLHRHSGIRMSPVPLWVSISPALPSYDIVIYLYLTTSHLGVMRKGGQYPSTSVFVVSISGKPFAIAS